MRISRKAVCDGTVGPLTEELGVELRLRDCLPSRPLDLLLATIGGMLGVAEGIWGDTLTVQKQTETVDSWGYESEKKAEKR